MRKFAKDLFTGLDGHTYDLGRVLLAVAVVSAIFLAVYAAVWRGSAFDIQAYGIGIGGLLFGGGGMLWVKRDTEPRPPITLTKESGPGTSTTTLSQDSDKGTTS